MTEPKSEAAEEERKSTAEPPDDPPREPVDELEEEWRYRRQMDLANLRRAQG